MFPIGDENPTSSRPIMNWIIISTCVVIFLWQSLGSSDHFRNSILTYGLIPSHISVGAKLHTLLTNIFLHGGWTHLAGNMVFLWVFGDNIEDTYGHIRYVLFYVFCGLSASVFWLFTAWGSSYPAVGASGAISGILGAYFILHPRARIRTLVSLGFFWRIVRIPAFIMIGLWFLYQFLLAFIPINTGIAYWAHIGGFIVGVLFSRNIKPHTSSTERYFDQYYL